MTSSCLNIKNPESYEASSILRFSGRASDPGTVLLFCSGSKDVYCLAASCVCFEVKISLLQCQPHLICYNKKDLAKLLAKCDADFVLFRYRFMLSASDPYVLSSGMT